jgi:4a-hydroxytetrahydrobiopterin dehydratase
MKKLTEQEVQNKLSAEKTWSLNSKGQIEAQFEFKDFKESMLFVNSVAFLSEKINHHPDILILWNKVRLSVSTHDAKGLTSLDFQLAHLVNELMLTKRT